MFLFKNMLRFNLDDEVGEHDEIELTGVNVISFSFVLYDGCFDFLSGV